MSAFQPLYVPYTPSPKTVTVTVVELRGGETAVTAELAVRENEFCAPTLIGGEEDVALPVRRVIDRVEARIVVRGNLANDRERYHTVELPSGERHTLLLPGT